MMGSHFLDAKSMTRRNQALKTMALFAKSLTILSFPLKIRRLRRGTGEGTCKLNL
jgi:hypothetical protein